MNTRIQTRATGKMAGRSLPLMAILVFVQALTACSGSSAPEPSPPSPPAPPAAKPFVGQFIWPISGFAIDNLTGQEYSIGTVVTGRGLQTATRVIEIESIDPVVSVRGPVDSIDIAHSRLTVMGQPVRYFEIFGDCTDCRHGLPLVQAGDFVSISGFGSVSGPILATRIDHEHPDLTAVTVAGQVDSLDPAAQTFQINDLVIDYSGATTFEGFPGSLLPGDQVQIFGSLEESPAVLMASRMTRYHPLTSALPDSVVILDGLVTDLRSETEFDVAGYSVIAENCSSQLNELIHIVGTVDASGVFNATDCQNNSMTGGLISGPIDAIDADNESLVVLGFKIQANFATRLYDGLSQPTWLNFTDLSINDFVWINYLRTEISSDDDGPLASWAGHSPAPDPNGTITGSLEKRPSDGSEEMSIVPMWQITFEGSDLIYLGQVIYTDADTQYLDCNVSSSASHYRLAITEWGGYTYKITVVRDINGALLAVEILYTSSDFCILE